MISSLALIASDFMDAITSSLMQTAVLKSLQNYRKYRQVVLAGLLVCSNLESIETGQAFKINAQSI
jgi:hypothetical protein